MRGSARIQLPACGESAGRAVLTAGLIHLSLTDCRLRRIPDRQEKGRSAISANGSTNGILWAIRKNGGSSGTLHAYDATNLAVELYNSDQAGARDTLDVAAKFSIPLVINGRVYVASEGKLTIYGLLP